MDGKTPENLQNELSETMKAFMLDRVSREEKEIEQYISERIRDISDEPKYQAAVNKEQYIRFRTEELEKSREERIKNMRGKINREYRFVHSFFSAVKVGQSIVYQTATPDGNVDVPAVFWGSKSIPTKRIRMRPALLPHE